MTRLLFALTVVSGISGALVVAMTANQSVAQSLPTLSLELPSGENTLSDGLTLPIIGKLPTLSMGGERSEGLQIETPAPGSKPAGGARQTLQLAAPVPAPTLQSPQIQPAAKATLSVQSLQTQTAQPEAAQPAAPQLPVLMLSTEPKDENPTTAKPTVVQANTQSTQQSPQSVLQIAQKEIAQLRNSVAALQAQNTLKNDEIKDLKAKIAQSDTNSAATTPPADLDKATKALAQSQAQLASARQAIKQLQATVTKLRAQTPGSTVAVGATIPQVTDTGWSHNIEFSQGQINLTTKQRLFLKGALRRAPKGGCLVIYGGADKTKVATNASYKSNTELSALRAASASAVVKDFSADRAANSVIIGLGAAKSISTKLADQRRLSVLHSEIACQELAALD